MLKKPKIGKLMPGQKQLAHITEELYSKNVELADRNKVLSLLRTIDDLMLGSQASPRELASMLVEILVQQDDFNYVQLFLRHTDRTHLHSLALAGEISDEQKSIAKNLRIKKSLNKQLRHSEKVETASRLVDVLETTSKKELAEIDMMLDIERVYIVPLRARGLMTGLLIIGTPSYTTHADQFRIDLMTRLMSVVGVSMDSALLVEQLKNTNNKLKELDAAKDEFISMASHQLRTPLTTVKGYLSMVLEGDVGKLNKQQHEFVDQAFGSAQRMVYLIADLLNVSRLNTGKFVIDAGPTNLAEVVQQEIDQLQRHAATREITLTYKKPKNFPIVNLDETKIRQVIMNFTDNAIYYTPTGGKVSVKLEKKGQSIEFTVTDTGIGVPKELQHKLFEKFYRAENAKQARPDGTGLGLFMAKKVVIAQGGAVLFNSVEGKGSTFGFTFPLKPLLANKAKDKPA